MVGATLKRQAKRVYEGFPDLSSCWEQSKAHKKHFLDHLDCPTRQLYHSNEQGCKPFDRLVAKIAGERHKLTFFNYYKVLGNKPSVAEYTHGLVTNPRVLRSLANNVFIVKKMREELEVVPDEYVEWPAHFTLESSKAFIFQEDREEIQKALENCITRRTLFRNGCIKDCNRLIDTRSHDGFLLVLQTLRARNIVFH